MYIFSEVQFLTIVYEAIFLAASLPMPRLRMDRSTQCNEIHNNLLFMVVKIMSTLSDARLLTVGWVQVQGIHICRIIS